MRAHPVCRACRPGLSLLEVLVALTIFLLAFVALGRLILLGTDLAHDAQDQSRAVQLCQAKLAEVVAGAVPLTPQTPIPFDEAPEWRWSLECEQSSIMGLWNVTVHVRKARPDESAVDHALRRMVLDPRMRGNVLDDIPDPSGTDDSTDSGSSSPSSQGSSSPGTGSSGAGTSGTAASTRGGN